MQTIQEGPEINLVEVQSRRYGKTWALLHEIIRRWTPVIQKFEVNYDNAKLIHYILVGRDFKNFLVRVEWNFLGDPYFTFYYKGIQLFGGEE